MIFDFVMNSPRFDDPECAKLENKDFFFPESKVELEERLNTLRSICKSCKHLAECRQYAIDEEMKYGFWGGMTPKEIQKIIQTKNRRKDRREQKFREVQNLLDLGFTKEQISALLGIKVASIDRRLARAQKRGIQ